jgi:protein-tyrosine phosphatase
MGGPRGRWIELPGCRNLRDVGGYSTSRGTEVAWGRLFRGAQLPQESELTDHLDAKIGIRRIIDLRTVEEIREHGAIWSGRGGDRLHLPLFTEIPQHWHLPVERTPAATAGRYFEMVQQGRSTMKRVVELLSSSPSVATLIHCVAGRDRTGIVIGSILDLLEVPDETIAEDYALSSVMDDAEGRHADPGNILLLLERIRREYGSVEDMLLGEGLAEGAVDRLRQNLTTAETIHQA